MTGYIAAYQYQHHEKQVYIDSTQACVDGTA